MDKKDGEDAEVQPDPHDGGSMRGEKMVRVRVPDVVPTNAQCQRRCEP